ncbi:hypothetical protein [Undibacterium sp. Dicai25W]|uniref:hypothetical protein n=1 Tax=Undibacterium sp. Dicai25W TaxID=3413034 RepID=UPI003BF4919C
MSDMQPEDIVTFNSSNKKRDVIATTEIEIYPCKTEHLRSPLTTKTWQQSTENSSTLKVIFDNLVMRDTPDHHGYALLELPYNTVVKQGAEEPQFTDNISWTNVVSDSIKGWVLAEGVVTYTPQTRFNTIAAFKIDEKADEAKQKFKPPEKPLNTLKKSGSISSQATTEAPDAMSSCSLYRVMLNYLAMRSAPEINAQLLKKLQLGQLVAALPQTVRGSWIAVHVDGHMGWVNHQWIKAISIN